MSEQLTTNERREWAKWLFINTDETIPDIALTVDADEDTVRAWVNEERWQQVKRSRNTSRAAQLDYLYATLENLRKDKDGNLKEANPKDADLILKYTNAIKNLESETTVSEIIEVFELFVRWLRRRDLALTKKITPYLDAFIKEHLAA